MGLNPHNNSWYWKPYHYCGLTPHSRSWHGYYMKLSACYLPVGFPVTVLSSPQLNSHLLWLKNPQIVVALLKYSGFLLLVLVVPIYLCTFWYPILGKPTFSKKNAGFVSCQQSLLPDSKLPHQSKWSVANELQTPPAKNMSHPRRTDWRPLNQGLLAGTPARNLPASVSGCSGHIW